MKKFLTAFTCLCFSLAGFAQDISKELDAAIAAYVKAGKFNGAVLVAKGGSILLNKGYGVSEATTQKPNTENSIFQIGSVTKQFTTAVILKLQEEKKLSVQDKISKFFPDYPKGDSITVEQLMLHTSGIFSYTRDRKFMSGEESKPHTREQMMALFKDKPLDFPPGTSWNYSNSGYSMLGYIIEAVTKKPWESVVREYIFKPVKMTHSGFDFAGLKHQHKTTGYFMLSEADTLKSPIVDSSVAYSAGSIYSTTGDLYRWHKALQNYSILPKALQEKAYTPVKNNYGYGWAIDSIAGKRRVSHGGGIHGYTSNFARIPEDDFVVILLSNTSSTALHEMTNVLMSATYKKPYELPKLRIAVSLPEEKLKEYVGKYEINPNLQLELSIKDGNLLAKPTGQRPLTVFAEKEDFFFAKTPDVQLEFKRNDKKEITRFTLYQNGRKAECRKIE